jgi:CRP/FNR family cyclic AMP-dependent transcriptional regulator
MDELFEMLVADIEAGNLAARACRFAKGVVVFDEGSSGDTVHLVVDGLFAVRIATPGPGSLILDILDQGDVFGEFAVFSDRGTRTSSITTLSEGETLEIGRPQLREALHARPSLCEGFVKTIVEKADRTNHRLGDLLYVPAELRVLRAVLELAGGQDGVVIALTQRDLASFAGTTRPTANHVLREEARKGTLSVEPGQVAVLDAVGLARRAGVSSERHSD